MAFSVLCISDVDLSNTMQDLVIHRDDTGEIYYQLDYDLVTSFGRTDIRAQYMLDLGGTLSDQCCRTCLLNHLLCRQMNDGKRQDQNSADWFDPVLNCSQGNTAPS